jgi:hypothetical protein
VKIALPLLMAVTTLSAPAGAQVVASQAPTPTPHARQEICPLQLDIDIRDLEKTSRQAFATMPAGSSLITRTDQYACDKARVQSVSIAKETDRPREVLVTVNAHLASDWMRQDVNVTVALLVNGEVKKSEEFRDLTIGDPDANWASRNISFAGSSSKVRGLRFWIKRKQFQEWFAPESKPSVRVTLAVVDNDDDSDDDD